MDTRSDFLDYYSHWRSDYGSNQGQNISREEAWKAMVYWLNQGMTLGKQCEQNVKSIVSHFGRGIDEPFEMSEEEWTDMYDWIYDKIGSDDDACKWFEFLCEDFDASELP